VPDLNLSHVKRIDMLLDFCDVLRFRFDVDGNVVIWPRNALSAYYMLLLMVKDAIDDKGPKWADCFLAKVTVQNLLRLVFVLVLVENLPSVVFYKCVFSSVAIVEVAGCKEDAGPRCFASQRVGPHFAL
jgi:hypothetical protein